MENFPQKDEKDLKCCVLGIDKWLKKNKFEKWLQSSGIRFERVKKVTGQTFAHIKFAVSSLHESLVINLLEHRR
jgi:hypothetical protein